MDCQTIIQKLNCAQGSKFCKLKLRDRKRMGGAHTNYLPSVEEVAKVISSIPAGETRTVQELRKELALIGKAETSCPATFIKYWKWMANLTIEQKLKNKKYDIPWWRVLKGGKPSKHMPGGIDNQKKILRKEGVVL
jgi:alkylated DNA nucleotide flippase Atl1